MREMKPVKILRTKRALDNGRFYVSDIQSDKLSNISPHWHSVAAQLCPTAADLHQDTGTQTVKGTWATLISKENTDHEQYYGYTQDITDENGVTCIPVWCEFNVVLRLSKSNSLEVNVLQPTPDHTIAIVEKLLEKF